METKQKIHSFTDLEAWKKAHTLVVGIYLHTKKYPKDEQFGITNQMRRAAVSITSNIAEGFSRVSPKEKAQFYAIAQGSLTELQNQLLISRDVGYVTPLEHREIESQLVTVHKLINGLSKYVRTLFSFLLFTLIPYTFYFILLVFPIILSTIYFIPTPVSAAARLQMPPNYLILNSGLVGYWTFDGNDTPWTSATAATTLDRSGSGNTGTLTNMNQATSTAIGKIGQALRFNGVSAFVSLGDISTVVGSDTEGSVSLWFTNENDTSSPLFHYGKNGSDTILFRLMFSSANTLQVLLKNPAGGDFYRATVNLGASSSNGSWHHIVFTVNASGNAMYYDGSKVTLTYSSGSAASTAWFDDITTENIGTVGRDRISSANNYHTGRIDDVRIYNRALSAGEVATLYQQGKARVNKSPTSFLTNGLVGYWTFDGATTTWSSATAGITGDSSGNFNTGTLTNMNQATSPAIGKIGQGLNFDGVNDRVVTTDIASYDAFTSTTQCAWVKHNSLTTDDVILAKWSGALNPGFVLFRDDVGGVSGRTDIYAIFIAETGAGGSNARVEGATNASQINTWTHVCSTVVLGNSSGLRLYINGVEDANSPVSTTAIDNIDSGTNTFQIGDYAASQRPFDGLIDDVRIYNRALSADEILQLYNSTR